MTDLSVEEFKALLESRRQELLDSPKTQKGPGGANRPRPSGVIAKYNATKSKQRGKRKYNDFFNR